MNIRCPHCQTMFRVNPDRIPASGVRAKCARCGDTFLVTRPPPAAGPSGPSGPATSPPDPSRAPESPPPSPTPVAQQQQPASPTPVMEQEASPAGPSPFGTRDPKAKAERLARALVSDIVAYHPERLARSYESGTLRTEFRDEIMKSWEEYVAQVGIDLAKATPYFRDALNNILAKGQKVF